MLQDRCENDEEDRNDDDDDGLRGIINSNTIKISHVKYFQTNTKPFFTLSLTLPLSLLSSSVLNRISLGFINALLNSGYFSSIDLWQTYSPITFKHQGVPVERVVCSIFSPFCLFRSFALVWNSFYSSSLDSECLPLGRDVYVCIPIYLCVESIYVCFFLGERAREAVDISLTVS